MEATAAGNGGDSGGSGSGGGGGGGGDDRVMATAQQILKSLNTPKEVREDMLLIFSSFDNRLSNLTSLVNNEQQPVKNSNSYEGDVYDDVGEESAEAAEARIRLDEAEKVIFRYESDSSSSTATASRNSALPSFEGLPDEAAEYLTAVDDILDLLDNLSIGSEVAEQADTAIQVAMSRLEEEFRHILIRNTVPLDLDRLYGSIRRFSLSFMSNAGVIDGEGEFESFGEEDGERGGCYHERGVSFGDDVSVDLVNGDAIVDLMDIADRMIRSRYEKECVQVYCNVRRDALGECLVILGVEKLSIEEVQKIEWKTLDEKMKKWVQAVKVGVRILLTGEKRLCENIFSMSDSAKRSCFDEIAKWCVMQLLNFGEAVAIVKRSTEKLFRILDMYDALASVVPELEMMVNNDYLCHETQGVLQALGEAAKGTFKEFENAVQKETSKKPMIGGEIHPVTRYVMNYIKLVVDYSGTLNSLLESDEDRNIGLRNDENDSQGSQVDVVTPIARRLLDLLSNLESNLEEKSRSYEDSAMQYIFLMNNVLYVVQKVKESELIKILGDQCVRKRRGQIKQYATAYLRASWTKALSCLKDEGIGGSSNNASKVALKEKFKSFNACFEDIYRIQSGWKVPDSQLRDELRIAISEKVIPAYRSFLGRYGSQLESGKHAGKYIKYTAEDLENYLSDLFEGMPLVLHHLRRKSA